MKTEDNMNRPQKLSRKMRKILVEKKRRERIDKCLKQIKDLLFQGTEFQHDYMRMEKADILENVVKFLQCQTLGDPSDRSTDYRLGFMHCMREVQQVLEHVCGTSNPLTLSITQYLHNRLNETCGNTTTGTSDRIPHGDECVKQEVISPIASSNSYDRSAISSNATATCSRVPVHPLHSLELHVGHMTCYGGNADLSEESFNEGFQGQGDLGGSSSGSGVVQSHVGSGEASQVVPSVGRGEGCRDTDNVRGESSSNNNNNDHPEQAHHELDGNMWRPW